MFGVKDSPLFVEELGKNIGARRALFELFFVFLRQFVEDVYRKGRGSSQPHYSGLYLLPVFLERLDAMLLDIGERSAFFAHRR